jgi:hypothetical protein
MSFFTKIKKINPKFMWKHKRSQVAKAILSKKSNTRDIISDFKLYYRAIVTKTALDWHKIETKIHGID